MAAKRTQRASFMPLCYIKVAIILLACLDSAQGSIGTAGLEDSNNLARASGRSLLGPCSTNGSFESSPGSPGCTAIPVTSGVQVVEGGSVVRECTLRNNMVFLAGTSVLDARSNIQPSVTDCCKSCFEETNCSVWVYCNLPGGCRYTPEGKSEMVYPHHGCELIELPGFHRTFNDTSEFRVASSDVPFFAGAPFSLYLPTLIGYEEHRGSDLNGLYDYSCSYNPGGQDCRLEGTPSEIANICNTDPRCRGFVYLPPDTGLTDTPLGIMKGGSPDIVLDSKMLVVNPSTAVYIMRPGYFSTEEQPVSGQESNNSEEVEHNHDYLVIWMALSITAAVVFAVIAATAIIIAVMTQRRAQAFNTQAPMMCSSCKKAKDEAASMLLVPKGGGLQSSPRMPSPPPSV